MKNLGLALFLFCLALPALGQDNLIYPEQIDRRIWDVTPAFENFPTSAEIEDLRLAVGDVIRTATSGLQEYLGSLTWRSWPYSSTVFSVSEIISTSGTINILNASEVTIVNATTTVLNVTEVVAGDVIINNATSLVFVTNILNATEITVVENVYYQNTYVSSATVWNTTNITQILNYIFHELDDLEMNEELSGAIDGSNRTFTTTRTIYNHKIDVYVLDTTPDSYPLKLSPADYVVSGTNTVTLREAPLAVNPYTRQAITSEIYATYVTDSFSE